MSRPRTPSKSPVPQTFDPPPVPQVEPAQGGQRRTSFGFLRRGKSVERLNKRSVSNGKLTKRQLKEQETAAASVPQQAPKIPDLATQPQLQTFGGGENARPESFAIMANRFHQHHGPPNSRDMRGSPYNVPIPKVPTDPKGGYVDPYGRTESMTNRGRYSYASSAHSTLNSPRRVRRRKDPTPFNILVVGARNSGKSSFIEFLKTSLTLPPRKQRHVHDSSFEGDIPKRYASNFISHYVETEAEDGERVGVTLWDSEGLEENIFDIQLREIVSFIESKFEDTFKEETRVFRTPGVRDTHIHCVILVLDPVRLDTTIATAKKNREAASNNKFVNGQSYIRDPSPPTTHGLDHDFDLQTLYGLRGKTTVIPIISKADTITTDHMKSLKRAVWTSLKQSNLDPFEALGMEEVEVDTDEDEEFRTPPKTTRPRHDSKRFDERDEEILLPSTNRSKTLSSSALVQTSHLDTSTSSSTDSSGLSSLSNTPPPPPSNHSLLTHRPFNHSLPTHRPFNHNPSETTDPHLPFSILSPDPIIAHQPSVGQVARRFPWGEADPYRKEHCDFVRLTEAVFREWRREMREASREVWYEGWRSSRLDGGKGDVGDVRDVVDYGEVGVAR